LHLLVVKQKVYHLFFVLFLFNPLRQPAKIAMEAGMVVSVRIKKGEFYGQEVIVQQGNQYWSMYGMKETVTYSLTPISKLDRLFHLELVA